MLMWMLPLFSTRKMLLQLWSWQKICCCVFFSRMLRFLCIHIVLCRLVSNAANAQCYVPNLLKYVVAYVQNGCFLINTHQTSLPKLPGSIEPKWKNELIFEQESTRKTEWVAVCVYDKRLLINSKIETIPMRIFLICARIAYDFWSCDLCSFFLDYTIFNFNSIANHFFEVSCNFSNSYG